MQPRHPQKRLPIVHRVLAGELKHHYLLKDGSIGYQRAPLTPASNRQRIGYQMLADETGAAFVDLHLVDEGGKPRLEMVYAFLALAWSSPALLDDPPRPIGLPDVLLMPRKATTDRGRELLDKLGAELGFRVEQPSSGFDAGVHLVKHISTALNVGPIDARQKNKDWGAEGNLAHLSYIVSVEVTYILKKNAPMRDLYAASIGTEIVYERRTLPQGWLSDVAEMYGTTEPQLKELCFPFFLEPQDAD